MHSLKNKLALITGGTSGIGKAVAENFVASGARTMICGRRADGAQIAERIGAVFVALDVTDEAAVQQTLADIVAEHGNLGIVVANAGMAEDGGTLSDSSSDYFRRCVDVNLGGVYHLIKHAAAQMNDGGVILTTGSAAGSGVTAPGFGEYAAAKAGVAYLSRTAALELAPRGIRVNCVCPGAIADTGMTVADGDNPVAEFYRSITALGRMGRLDEVVGLYNFLASDAASFITGQEIRVDGGMSAGFGLPLLSKI